MDGDGERRKRRRPPRHLLPFQRTMVEELISEDGLCVMASGMGLTSIAGALLRLQVARRRTPGQRGVAFVIGAAEWQRDLLMEELEELDEDDEGEEGDEDQAEEEAEGGDEGAFAALRRGGRRERRRQRQRRHGPAAAVVTAETPAASRASLYATAGVIFISTRILVVDFLTGRVAGPGGATTANDNGSSTAATELAGLLVLNAHRSTPNSADAFAAALARSAAPGTWLRALSDAPPAFLAGFARAERVLGALRIRKLRLWPRFEATVKEALAVSGGGGGDAAPPANDDDVVEVDDDGGGERKTPSAPSSSAVQVVELAVRPTPEMASCYEAIAELMEACLRELRRCPALAAAATTASDGGGGNGGDSLSLTLEGAGVLPSSDAAIARALEAAGMRGGGSGAASASAARARGAAADLRSLRSLADALLRLDAVTFLRRLETLRAVDTSVGSLSGGIGGGGGWLLHDAAHALFSAAKRRVFVLVRESERADAGGGGGGGGKRRRGNDRNASDISASSPASVVPVLEPLPKWSLVLDILAEIQAERERLLSSSFSSTSSAAASAAARARVAAAEAPVLVVSRDARTAAQLRACVAAGGTEPVMRSLYDDYLLSRLSAASSSSSSSSSRGGGGGGRGRGRGGRGGGRGAPSSSSARPAVERLGQARAARLRGSTAEEAALLQEARKEKKRQRERERERGDDGDNDDDVAAPSSAPPSTARATAAPAFIFDDFDDGAEDGGALAAATSRHPLLQGVSFACLDDHSAVSALVRRCRPSFLVVCDPDVSFVRTVELYAASLGREDFGDGGDGAGGGLPTNGGESGVRRPLRVYHLRYEHSLESDAYSAKLRRERKAFESLISAKSHMALPDHAAERRAVSEAIATIANPSTSAQLMSLSPPRGDSAPAPSASALLPLSSVARPSDASNELTRLGGGGAARDRAARRAAALSRVVVDVREFMASAALPAALHARGMTLCPVTLEVGDYVLSPALCVERKAIPDLRQSLNSGRLLTQARAMVKHYPTAVLLIEFDGDKPFSLNGGAASGDGGGGVSSSASSLVTPFDSGAHSLPARLAILALHVPRLRFLWARSPHAAADLFVELKRGAAREPEPEAAAAVGNDEAAAASGGEEAAAAASRSENAPAVDLLRKLPGVTDHNWRALASAAGSLAGLAKMSEGEIADAIGGRESVAAANSARRLRAFLDGPCPAL